MPKALHPDGGEVERALVKKAKNSEDKYNLRIGAFYSKFNTHQRKRFNKIVDSICRKLGIHQYRSPVEMTLVRLIAVNQIRVEKAMNEAMGEENPEYGSDREKWLLLNQKEIREGINLLNNITKVAGKKEGISNFDMLRDNFRKEEGLKPSKQKGLLPDGKDRRYHIDGVTRSEK